ncbi:MAG TPA: RICIN domain-containing protein [Pseudonocardiaceae bacterium]|jgi:glucosylceramidase|nr:RICIN domain-containing protein [Pseudonocardiaceae bacterium]
MRNVRLALRRRLGVYGASVVLTAVGGLAATATIAPPANATSTTLQAWLTTPDGSSALTPQPGVTLGSVTRGAINVDVNDSQTYQTISGGFGASFTDSSGYLLQNLKAANPTAYGTLTNQMYGTTSGLGLQMWRVPMGSSDFTAASAFWTDDDTQGPSTDPTQYFGLTTNDTQHVIPSIKDALAINRNLRIVASPWSAPAWMKNTDSLICNVNKTNGVLLGQYDQAWADYFVKWIQAYQAAGVPIWGITPQNEPGYCPTSYPGMEWTESGEASWVHSYLKPTLAAAGLNPVVLGYDHNWDNPSFPEGLLSGSTAGDYGGTAWHCYNNDSDPTVMTQAHDLYPGYDNYETECASDTSPTNIIPLSTAEVALLSVQNWAPGVTYWNPVLDPNNGPHLGGCTTCVPTVAIIPDNGSGYTLANNFYNLGQIAEFVPVGSTHIASTVNAHGIVTAAVKRPDGQETLVATNRNSGSTSFEVTWNGQGSFSYTLPSRATVTFMGSVSPAPALSNVPSAGHTYKITAKMSGKPIDISGGSVSTAASAVQFTDDGDLSQQWTLVDAGSGYFNLVDVHSGLALTVPHGSGVNGTQLDQETISGTGTAYQQWQFVSLGNGWYDLTDKGNGQAIDLRSGSIADNAVIEQWAVSATDANQQWQLVPVS